MSGKGNRIVGCDMLKVGMNEIHPYLGLTTASYELVDLL